MSEHSQNNPTNPGGLKAGASHAARKLSCEEWEAMLVDFLDGTLASNDTEPFHSHEQTCASCAEMFSHAGQGREWLTFLRHEPPVPSVLVTRILAQTSGAAPRTQPVGEVVSVSAMAVPDIPAVPFWKRASTSHMMGHRRFMMTAAMAFFSITLTLNMAGVRLSAVRLADLKPSSVSSNLDKQYHMASARVVRYYDNLRFVYEMEAKVREIRRDADLVNTPADKPETPSSSPAPQENHKSGGKSEGPSARQPAAMLWGEQIEAALRNPSWKFEGHPQIGDEVEGHAGARTMEHNQPGTADQAERGIA